MRKTKFFLMLILLFALKTSTAQETWYEHGVSYFGNPPHAPNLNSVFIRSQYWGLVCGDSGYIAKRIMPVEDYWQRNFILITNKNLYSICDVDSTYTKAYIVGENGKIFKTNVAFPGTGDIQFYNQTSPTTRNLYSVYFTVYSNGIAVGDTGTVIRTTDGGSHWTSINSGTQNRLYSVHFPSANIGYAVGVNGIVIKSSDNGQNWVIRTSPVTDTLRCVWFTNDNTGFVVSRNGAIYKTTDGGNTWQIKPSGTTENINTIRFVTSNTGYAAGNNKKVLKTIDAGETWTIQTLPAYFRQGNYKGIGTSAEGEVTIVGSNGAVISNKPEGSSIKENFKKGEIILLPNPAQGKITIYVKGFENLSNLQTLIYDVQGRLLLNKTLQQNNNEIDISQLQQGVYVAKIKLDDGSFLQKKFVVMK